MNPGWKFFSGSIETRNFEAIHAIHYAAPEWIKAGNHGLSKVGYTGSGWEDVNLPHDSVVGGEFNASENTTHGSLPTEMGWYRKEFSLPDDSSGKRIAIEFDGVFRDCEIWLNGHFVGRHLSGYTSFEFDVTELCRVGALNALAVRIDPRVFELWSYEGGGIYRDVRLVVTDAVRIPYQGVHVRTQMEDCEAVKDATVKALIAVENSSFEPARGSVFAEVLAPDGTVQSSEKAAFTAGKLETVHVAIDLAVDRPLIWSPDEPNLYRLVIRTESETHGVDELALRFGFRNIRFDPKTGFYLNGKSLKLKGVCEHQDHAGVGIAIPHDLQRWRIEQVKSMGANAIRTAHNPPDPALLDLCDELGMMVVNEARLPGIAPELLDQLEALVRRDRNHPSVILWSLGNEEMNIQETSEGPRLLRVMQERLRKLDPDRPSTYSANCDFNEIAENFDRHDFRVDVFGANYTSRRGEDGKLTCEAERYDEFHAQFPDWSLVAAEAGGTMSTRGLYGLEYLDGKPIEPHPDAMQGDPVIDINPDREGYATAYSETMTPWGRSIEDTWRDCATRDFMAGVFLWTGFDYRGETYPFSWPSVVTRYGLLDLCGHPKDAFFYYKSQWSPKPVLHLFPHWNWEGREGETIDVCCYTNHQAVELFLNGESQGKQSIEAYGKGTWAVCYEPGTLKVVAYDAKGEALQSASVQTAGRPHAVQISADREVYDADGEAIMIISAAVVDEAGLLVPTANNKLTINLPEGLTFMGSGNGNPTSHESDQSPERLAYHGLAQFLFRVGREAGEYALEASAAGLETGTCSLSSQARPVRITELPGTYAASGKQADKLNPIDGAL
jgi:beta-galactosidase